jgi:nucleoside-diphosphate-sugar epimerase
MPERLASEINGAAAYPSHDFLNHDHEIIINCIGMSGYKDMKKPGMEIFSLHETWDNMILEYLKNGKKCLYISLSSGAVYGRSFTDPVGQDACLLNGISEISPEDFYAIAKLNCEAKHRSLENLSIVDLRIFSFISRFIDFNSNFLVSEIMTAIRNKQTFITDDRNISRDYLHPEDMMQIIDLLIKRWRKTGLINDTFDTYSKGPLTKKTMLKSLAEKFGLQYEVKKGANIDSSVTGFKMNYYSVNKKLKELGYEPRYSSLDAILKVLGDVL